MAKKSPYFSKAATHSDNGAAYFAEDKAAEKAAARADAKNALLTETEFEAATVRALCSNYDLSQTDAELLTGRLWGEMGFAYDDNRTPCEAAAILTGNLDPKHEEKMAALDYANKFDR